MFRNDDLAKAMNKKAPAYHVYEYKDMLRVFSETVQELVIEGEVVNIRGLGTFYPHQTKERNVYDILTGAVKRVESSFILKFKTAELLARKIRKIVLAERKQKKEQQGETSSD
jgi:nucleoid DNA-binding protein